MALVMVVIHVEDGKMSKPYIYPSGDVAGTYHREFEAHNDRLQDLICACTGSNGTAVAMVLANGQTLIEIMSSDEGPRAGSSADGIEVLQRMVEGLVREVCPRMS